MIAAIRALALRLIGKAQPPVDPTEQARRDALAWSIDQSLAARRRDRAERQEAARQREAAKHHAHFIRDPLIRATVRQTQGR